MNKTLSTPDFSREEITQLTRFDKVITISSITQTIPRKFSTTDRNLQSDPPTRDQYHAAPSEKNVKLNHMSGNEFLYNQVK